MCLIPSYLEISKDGNMLWNVDNINTDSNFFLPYYIGFFPVSVIDKQECDDGFVLFAVSNASKCYLFHEFSNPSMVSYLFLNRFKRNQICD